MRRIQRHIMLFQAINAEELHEAILKKVQSLQKEDYIEDVDISPYVDNEGIHRAFVVVELVLQ